MTRSLRTTPIYFAPPDARDRDRDRDPDRDHDRDRDRDHDRDHDPDPDPDHDPDRHLFFALRIDIYFLQYGRPRNSIAELFIVIHALYLALYPPLAS